MKGVILFLCYNKLMDDMEGWDLLMISEPTRTCKKVICVGRWNMSYPIK